AFQLNNEGSFQFGLGENQSPSPQCTSVRLRGGRQPAGFRPGSSPSADCGASLRKSRAHAFHRLLRMRALATRVASAPSSNNSWRCGECAAQVREWRKQRKKAAQQKRLAGPRGLVKMAALNIKSFFTFMLNTAVALIRSRNSFKQFQI